MRRPEAAQRPGRAKAVRIAAGLAAGACVLLAAPASPAVAAEDPTDPPALARAHLGGGEMGGGETSGAVFFLPLEAEPGAVAVGSAHAFDRTRLAEAGRVVFRLPGASSADGPDAPPDAARGPGPPAGEGAAARGERTRPGRTDAADARGTSRPGPRVAASRRYLAPPGRAYHRPGATLRGDFVLFKLEAAPEGVRLLEPAPDLPEPGARVRVEGLPRGGGPVALAGRVVRSEADAIEVALDERADLRGFGGAPVLLESGAVVGLLQSAQPTQEGMRVGVGPIGGVLEARAAPYEGGLGRLFASLAPQPSAATDPGFRRREAADSPFGSRPPEALAAEVVAAAVRRGAARQEEGAARVALEIDHPPPGAVVGDVGSAFLAGRAEARAGPRRRLDLAFVIDTSFSANAASGVDVDGDGEVGEARVVGRLRDGTPVTESTDPGDSVLASETAAARELLAGLDPRHTRVALLTFAGEPENPRTRVMLERLRAAREDRPPSAVRALAGGPRVVRAATTEEPLTTDYDRIRRALDEVRERGAQGATHMAAGIDQATLELLGLEGSISLADPRSEKVVLFFTDGEPTLPSFDSPAENVRAVMEAAERARRAGVKVHSFAIGPEALGGPVAAVEMAAITGGLFTPVREPGQLVRFMELVNLAGVQDVQVRNATTGATAYQVRLHADGAWDALVPLAEGENTIEVRARSDLGGEGRATHVLHQRPGSEAPPLPAELVTKRTDLLRLRLDALQRARVERQRKELVIEIERERARALERAERQRKELQIDAVPPGEASAPDEAPPSPSASDRD